MSDQNTSGRIRVSLRKAEPEQEAALSREIPRIVRLLALAHRWHRLIDEGTFASQAELAAVFGVSTARVTQIMSLATLAPALQQELARWTSGMDSVATISGPAAWRIVRKLNWSSQLMVRQDMMGYRAPCRTTGLEDQRDREL